MTFCKLVLPGLVALTLSTVTANALSDHALVSDHTEIGTAVADSTVDPVPPAPANDAAPADLPVEDVPPDPTADDPVPDEPQNDGQAIDCPPGGDGTDTCPIDPNAANAPVQDIPPEPLPDEPTLDEPPPDEPPPDAPAPQ